MMWGWLVCYELVGEVVMNIISSGLICVFLVDYRGSWYDWGVVCGVVLVLLVVFCRFFVFCVCCVLEWLLLCVVIW